MAKRNYSVMKKSSKIEPAVLRFQVALPTLTQASPIGTSYLDISQIASVLNRRFYRQGLNWAVADIKHMATTSDGSNVSGLVDIQKCPNTWVFHNAWKKSFETWRQMIKNATDESGAQSIKGKFLDFKIYADAAHHSAGFAGNLAPLDGAGGLYAAGQWQPSEIEIPNTVGSTHTRELIAVGPNLPGVSPVSGHNAVSVTQGYADSRALPSPVDPNVPADANTNWMVELFDSVSDQDGAIIADLEVMGNNPPYPFEGDQAGNLGTMYPGGETNAPTLQEHDSQYITGTTVGGHTHLVGGLFPCGLMKITTSATITGDTQVFQGLYIELCPGDHRGYLAESMS